MKMLLVGAGFIARTHASVSRQSSSYSYIGVVDTNPVRSKEFGEDFGINSYSMLEIALEELCPEGVVVCVPTNYHLEIIRTCAKYKVAVFCEKPIALSLEEAEEIKQITEQSNTKIMIGHVTRFWPEYREALNYIQNESYGEIENVHLERLSSPPRINSWISDIKQGGGALYDLQIHDLDFLQQLLGAPHTLTSYSDLSSTRQHMSVHNFFEYDNKTIVTNKASYTMPESFIFRSFFRIKCSEATIEFDSNSSEPLSIYPSSGKAFTPSIRKRNPFVDEMEYFVNQVKNGLDFSINNIDHSIDALRICTKSHLSLILNQKVNMIPYF